MPTSSSFKTSAPRPPPALCAIAHFGGLGLDPPEAVMSDNGNCYRSYAFRAELERVGARQILTPPYTPRWNGKVERFFQTLKREWAYAHSWPDSARRSRALASFLRYYNPTPAQLAG